MYFSENIKKILFFLVWLDSWGTYLFPNKNISFMHHINKAIETNYLLLVINDINL